MRKLTKYLKYLTLFILASCDNESNLPAQYENYFVKYYGIDGNQQGVDLYQKQDGTFLILGNSRETGSHQQIWLSQADNLGNELWVNTFGGIQDEEAKDIAVDPPGIIYISGNVQEENSNATDIVIYKIDPSGILLDSAIFGFPNTSEIANDITITSTNELIVVGSTQNVDVTKSGFDPVNDLEDIYSIKMSFDLVPVQSFLWKSIIGYAYPDRAKRVIERTDGSFIFFGVSSRPNSDADKAGFNMMLYPTNDLGDPGGAPFETQFFGTLNNEAPTQIINTLDGGYALVGTTVQNGNQSIHMAVTRNTIKLVVNSFNISVIPDLRAASIAQSLRGGFLVLATSNQATNGNIELIKIDENANIAWINSFGGVDNDNAAKVIELIDGSIMILGTVELESQQKITLIKTNSFGELKP